MRFAGEGQGASRSEFARLVETVRTRIQAAGKMRIAKSVLDDVPEQHRTIAESVRREMEKHDAPLLLDGGMQLDVLLNLFESRYYMRETGLEDIDSFDAFVSKAWHDATGGKEDPYSRLTLFMCLATGAKPKTTVTEVEARAMVRRGRKDGFDSAAGAAFIEQEAPFELKHNLLALWEEEFLPEASERLLDDTDTAYVRALRFLSENCNVSAKAKSVRKTAK